MRPLKIILFFLTIGWLMSSCGRLRNIQPGESFLRRHDVVIHDAPKEFDIPKEEILAFSRLKPNRRILWLRFNHTVYLFVNKDKLTESQIKNKSKCDRKNAKRRMKKKLDKECKSWRMFWAYAVGEPTVLLDSMKMKKSAQQMNVFLEKNGYFRSRVEAEVVYQKDSTKCHVLYNVYPGTPYTIRNIKYQIADNEMAKYESDLREMSLLDSASIFDIDVFNAEREQIAAFYNDKGYYEFNKEYIIYDTDTSKGQKQVDLIMRLQLPLEAPSEFPDSLVSVPHKKYFIGDIYVHTHFESNSLNYAPTDTLSYDGLKIISYGAPDINPSIISCNQSYNKGDLYKKSSLDRTYKRYSQLGVFRATSIQLIPKKDFMSPNLNILDTHIRLTPAKKQSFTIDPHVTNRSGNMGIYGNVVYTHRNIFHGAESMDFKIITGLEASQTLVQTTTTTDGTGQQIKRNFKLNTFEIGPELTYRVPRLWPFSCDFSSASSDPQASVSAALNYQRRPDYERTLSQIRFTYNWIENPDVVRRVNIDLLEFSIIKIQKSETFQDFLNRLNDAFLANSYQNHLILSTNLGYTWNTQKAKYQPRYYYLRLGASGAGNLLNGIMTAIDAPVDTQGVHTLEGIRYAQYFRGEADYRYYVNVNEKNAFVGRIYGGIGVPRKNAITLPFEKSFYSGGSNGLRAWQARTIGPGSYRDPDNPQSFNNIGEIKIEGNLEYRFKMTKMLNWAIFVDAGNIWLINPDEIRPGADFTTDRFLGEIAIGSGIGARLDFDYFLVRLDMGIQLKDPAKIQGERWLWQPKNDYLMYLASTNNAVDKIPLRSNLVFNLGISYPF